MSLEAGHKLAHYEILEPIGKGGMGEVYRAKDGKLGRDVAIKVLPDEFGQDEERLKRFQREAKVLASLNHPNIASIYGVEQSGDTHYLVLELVPGETLAERIARGPIPVDEALEIATKIAEALEEAHEQGIVHRDLKPANVKLAPAEKIKVLDFGLAKAFAEDGQESDSSFSMSPTITREATRIGVILGTASYMSPEQARGQSVDRRADVWAFGVVLWEMLTGKRLFEEATVSDTLAAVLRAEPDWSSLTAETPTAIRRLLRRCLERNPKKRLRSMGDVGLEIEEGLAGPSPETSTATKVPSASVSLTITLPVILALVVASVWGWMRSPTSSSSGTTYLELEIPTGRLWGGHPDEARIGGQRPSRPSFAIAPDGRAIVYAAADGDEGRLYLRRLDQPHPIALPGTEGAFEPFFSPDGAWVGFVTDENRTLKRVPVDGGQTRTILSDTFVLFASWTENDAIVFTGEDGIYRTTPSGGSTECLTECMTEGRRGEEALYPQMLPGDDTLLYTLAKGSRYLEESEVVAASVGGEPTVLLRDAIAARYLPTGHLVFARQGTLMAVGFDAGALELRGEPVRVLEDVMQSLAASNTSINSGAAQFAVSDSGTLAYAGGGLHEVRTSQIFWVDSKGEREPLPIPPVYALYPRLSLDGTKLAVVIGFGERELTVADVETGATAGFDVRGVTGVAWSPDGERLAISLPSADGPADLYLIDTNGGNPPERLTTSERSEGINDWSTDNVLAFVTGGDIWTIDLGEDGEPRPFVSGPARELLAAFSPDGRWLAYASDESGQYEVYVRPYPGPDPVYRVTRDGGSRPVWSPDGRRLFYRSGIDNRSKMMAIDISSSGGTFSASGARELFDQPYLGTTSRRSYDVTADGRFLMVEAWDVAQEPVTQLHVVLDWFDELERLVPTN